MLSNDVGESAEIVVYGIEDAFQLKSRYTLTINACWKRQLFSVPVSTTETQRPFCAI
jgi:hypothetical protein